MRSYVSDLRISHYFGHYFHVKEKAVFGRVMGGRRLQLWRVGVDVEAGEGGEDKVTTDLERVKRE